MPPWDKATPSALGLQAGGAGFQQLEPRSQALEFSSTSEWCTEAFCVDRCSTRFT